MRHILNQPDHTKIRVCLACGRRWPYTVPQQELDDCQPRPEIARLLWLQGYRPEGAAPFEDELARRCSQCRMPAGGARRGCICDDGRFDWG